MGADAQRLDGGGGDFFCQLAFGHGGASTGCLGLGVGGFFDVHLDHFQSF